MDKMEKITPRVDVAFKKIFGVEENNEADYNNRIKKALGVLEAMNFSDDEREGYEDHLKWLRMQMSTIKKYEQIAAAEGEARGEGLATHRIAKSLLKRGIETAIVMEDTGLTCEEVDKIKRSL